MRFVDLDDTTTELAYLVDLLSTFADNGADHVVGDIDLLRDRSSWHSSAAVHGLLSLRPTVGLGSSCVRRDMRLHMGCRSSISRALRAIVHGHGGVRRLSTCVRWVWRRVGRWGHMRSSFGMTAVVLASSVLARCGLRAVRHYLHASRDRTGRGATSSGVCRCGGSAESFVELFEKRAADVIRCNVHGVSNSHDY